jgi:uncharacterized protein YjbI with pentapeptide repeats
MNRDEALALLKGGKTGVELWNQRRAEEQTPDVDHADLSDTDLFGADLIRANLSDANLTGANLTGAAMVGADLSRSILTDAHLSGADLGGADFIHADLRDADLSGTILSGADLSQANLNGAILRDAHLIGANLRGAHLVGVDLIQANLRDANLSEANLSRAVLVGTKVRRSNLSDALFGWTVVSNVALWRATGLDTIRHLGPSELGGSILYRSDDQIPETFLRGCGVPETLIKHLPLLTVQSEVQFYSCFVCYAAQDKQIAQRLHDELQRLGIRCWLEEKPTPPGEVDEWEDRGFRFWDKVLLCASQHSLASLWVEDEIDAVLEREREMEKELRRTVRVLFAIDLDSYLDRWQGAKKDLIITRRVSDLAGWETDSAKFERGLGQVVQALRVNDGTGRTTASQ